MVKCQNCGGRHFTRHCESSGYPKSETSAGPELIATSRYSTSTEPLQPLIAVVPGDVEYFIRDVLQKGRSEGLAWLFALACESENGYMPKGNERPDEFVKSALPFIELPFALVLEARDEAEQREVMERLQVLQALRFSNGSSIRVFEIKGPKPERDSWSFVFEYVIPEFVRQLRLEEPEWFLQCDHFEGNRAQLQRITAGPPVERVAVVPAFPAGNSIFMFLVQQPHSLGAGVWTTIGGMPKRGKGGDGSVLGTAWREWSEEVLAYPIGFSLDEGEIEHSLIQWVTWKTNSRAWQNWGNWMPTGAQQLDDGVSSTAWLFVQATESFVSETIGRQVELIPGDAKVVRKSDPKDQRRLIHTEGFHFVEQEKGAWFRFDLSSGKLYTSFSAAQVRGDLGYTVLQSKGLRKRFADWRGQKLIDVPSDCCCHPAVISAEGLRNKLPVYELNYAGVSPEDSTTRLAVSVSEGYESDKYHQFYSEEIEALLKKGADPTVTGPLPPDVPSVLVAVLRNQNLRGNIALRSAELLCQELRRCGCQLSQEEKELLVQNQAASGPDLKWRWERISSSS
eukprot:TRINITY_DN78783_c0_g1_i1.p1 TRINITY_DN78783_c0_g1~~TRINITY_DN78783_c0_g1_i1.p1  ORF type:complete len:566 (-),score=76.77 TRINITY_DN78783_c0_g1_i1:154-1851(-)